MDDSNKGTILFDIDEDKDDLVIKQDFFVALIHYDVLNEFEIANIAAFVVNNTNKTICNKV